jgi:hypothetical protein
MSQLPDLKAAPLLPFAEAAVAAFPAILRDLARDAVRELTPLVNDRYRQRSTCVEVLGEPVHIPYRLRSAPS